MVWVVDSLVKCQCLLVVVSKQFWQQLEFHQNLALQLEVQHSINLAKKEQELVKKVLLVKVMEPVQEELDQDLENPSKKISKTWI